VTPSHTILVGIYSRFGPWNIPQEHFDWLRQQFPQHRFLHARTEDEALAMIGHADIVFTVEMRPNVFEGARQLKWIHSPAAGLGAMLFPAMVESPIVITNSRGLSADTIAEHVLLVTLAMFRKLPQCVEGQRSREWTQSAIASGPPIRTIAGSRVLIVGLGAIGNATGQRLAALSARIDGVRRRPDAPRPSWVERVVSPAHLSELLPTADVVVLAAPHTPASRHLIGRHELDVMRSGSLLVNVSRGALVDESALVDALTAPDATRRLAGAALDVFEQEPLSRDSPLWSLPNVLVTPHVAGFRPDHWAAVVSLFADNLRRFDSGQPLVNVVDKAGGY
jgi:phosphoglycerate dehydrogenase-like enzyme